MSESNLPPESWRPLFDRAGIEFGYRPLAARAGLTHTRVHRLVRGGGTTTEAIEQVAEALGVKASKIRELRDEPADPDPFILPDDAGRLNDTERDVVRRVVRALLDARDRTDEHSQESAEPDRPTPAARASRPKVEKARPSRSKLAQPGARMGGGRKPDDLSKRRASREAYIDRLDMVAPPPEVAAEWTPEDPADAKAARTRDPRFKPDIPEDDGIGEENQDDQ